MVWIRLWYALRMLSGGYLLAACCFAAAIAAYCLLLPELQPSAGSYQIRIAFIFFMPLLTIAVCAALFADDFRERTLACHFSYRRSQMLVFVERLFVALVLLAFYTIVLLLAVNRFSIALGGAEMSYIARHSLSVHLFAAAAGSLGSLLGRNMAVGLGGGAALWIMEFFMASTPQHRYYLFQAIWQVNPGLDPDQNAVGVAALAIVLLGGSLLMLWKGRGWLVRR